ncbi:unnamed protein product [Peniophora sp. CBMAI 1063]|nr:unnamed protein product [Peniophora sp. CBMAI 1063]
MTIQPLIFYDIPGNAWANKAWSPNCWKGRYALNIKNIPYKTIWVEYLEIEPTFKKAGIPPTGTRGGKDLYTCPAIVDPNTGTAVADSILIAEYVEKTYPNPDTPTLFPPGTRTLQLGFRDAFDQRARGNMVKSLIFQNIAQMSPESGAYWRRTREQYRFGKTLEEIVPQGEQLVATTRSILDGLHTVGQWIDAGEGGPFLMGKEPCFADVDIAAILKWVQLIVGKDEDGLWTAVAKVDGGRWAVYMKEFEKWDGCP